MNKFSTIDALIPARKGSTRVKGKNMRLLNGQPLIKYTIDAALKAGIFRRIVVSTDCFETKLYCKQFVEVIERPAEFATNTSLDVEWINHYLDSCEKKPDYFMILRPTSPFRTAETIIRAWELWQRSGEADSLRAISPVTQHPGKMWRVHGDRMTPLMNYPPVDGHDSFNLPTQVLPEVYVQNASLEIGQTRHVITRNTVSGWKIVPFFTHNMEGFDINTMDDWYLAERSLMECLKSK
jgi:CMP-N,N'-diacetyllegionaminic acid synthase